MLTEELKRLRHGGLEAASADSFPQLAQALEAWGRASADLSFGKQLDSLFREALRPLGQNARARDALELFSLHESTLTLSPTEARKVTVRRVKGKEPTTERIDAFSKNEQVKAFKLLESAIERLLDEEPATEIASELPYPLAAAIVEANLTRFFPSRDGYRKYRDGNDTISQYVSTARHSIEMVSINLATGNDIEAIASTFERAILRSEPVSVRISLIDPECDHVIASIAPVLGVSPVSLTDRIQDTLKALSDLRSDRLPRNKRSRLEVWCHQVLPNASAILLDADSDNGHIQLETKGFKTGMGKSWGFEVGAGSEFFLTLRESYRDLMDSGRQVL